MIVMCVRLYGCIFVAKQFLLKVNNLCNSKCQQQNHLILCFIKLSWCFSAAVDHLYSVSALMKFGDGGFVFSTNDNLQYPHTHTHIYKLANTFMQKSQDLTGILCRLGTVLTDSTSKRFTS